MRKEPRRDFLKTLFGTTFLTASALQTAHAQTDADERYRPTPDFVLATKSRIYGPAGICFDRTGNLYVVDQLHWRIRRIDASIGIITTVAGTGERGLSGDGGPAVRAKLDYPGRVFVDRQGNVFFTESIRDRVRRIDSKSGIVTTIAGNGAPRWEDRSRDGDPATKRSLDRPAGIGSDSQGNLIVCDSTRILKIDADTQRMTTLHEGRFGNGYPFPSDLTIDKHDNIYFAEMNTARLRVLRSDKTVETIYGKQYVANPVPDNNGMVFFVAAKMIHQLELSSMQTKIFAGDGSTNPSGLAVDAHGNVYFSDWLANRVYKIDRKTGVKETIAGNGEPKHPPRLIF
jgi:sugar lactone lactonase YvrE